LLALFEQKIDESIPTAQRARAAKQPSQPPAFRVDYDA
jgi:hypothetical protein